jgi:hypothetical protein
MDGSDGVAGSGARAGWDVTAACSVIAPVAWAAATTIDCSVATTESSAADASGITPVQATAVAATTNEMNRRFAGR